MLRKKQSGEIPLAHVLMLALIVLPVIIGMVYFLTSAEGELEQGGRDLKSEKSTLDRKVEELGDAFK